MGFLMYRRGHGRTPKDASALGTRAQLSERS